MATRIIHPPIKVGDTFGRWTVLSTAPLSIHNKRCWYCRCQCGVIRNVTDNLLKVGKSQSCGCLHRELVGQRSTTHGMSRKNAKAPEYAAWLAMKARTTYPRDPSFHLYAKRGITVCVGWAHSFENFFADTGSRPGAGYSIDRKNNNGHYSCGHCEECIMNNWPANCRWATAKEQANNRRTNRYITFQGKTLPLKQWAQEIGIQPMSLHARLKKHSLEDALSIPRDPTRPKNYKSRI